jgi:RNA polymerase sigma factor (TIGR02999 family)
MDGGTLEPAGESITRLLTQWGARHDDALQTLLPLVYGRMHELAQSFMRRRKPDHTLQPTALVGELYVRLANAIPPDLRDREHFCSFCACTMRWILTDHARRRQAEKRQLHLQVPFIDDIPWLGSRESTSALRHGGRL